MAFVVTTSKGEKKAFSSHKSARSFSRSSIAKGADWVFVHLKARPDDPKEEPILRNVYRAQVDTVNHTREHVRVPLEGWANLVAQQAQKGSASKGK